MYDTGLALTGIITLVFLPCLLMLVSIQVQNLYRN